jgi:hypothetical protein
MGLSTIVPEMTLMEQSDYSSIKVTVEAKKTWDEFLGRTHTSGIDAFEQFMCELRLLLDLMSPNKKILFLFNLEHSGTNRWVILRLSDALDSSFSEIPSELHKDILKEFGYDEKFHDLRLKKEDEQK